MPDITQAVNYRPLQSVPPAAPYSFDAQPKIDALDGKKFRALHNMNSEGQYTAIHSSKFQRVHPTQEEFAAKIGEEYRDLVTLEGDGVHTAKLKPNDNEVTADGQDNRKKALEGKTTAKEHGSKGAAESNEREFHEAFRKEMDTEEAPSNRGFFSKIWARMTGENEKLILSKGPDNTVALKTNTSQTTGDSLEVQPIQSNEIEDKTFWKKVRFGVGMLAAGGLLVAAGALPFILGAGAVLMTVGAVGGLAGLITLSKVCSNIKSPWWAGTVDGQRQWAERKAAVDVGDGIENMVRNQVLKGTRDEEGKSFNPANQSEWKAPELCKPETVVGWMKLAKQNSPDELKAKIREELLDRQKSFLDPQTIKDAKRRAITGWFFTGNPKGHAEKTVNIVAEEIYRGVIRGLASGYMGLVEAEMADAKTKTAQDELKPWLKQTSEDFKSALNRFAPAQEANQPGADDLASREFEFYETGKALAKVASYEEQAGAVQSQLDGMKAVIGESNHTVYSEVLKSFSHDLATYKSSLGVVDRIVHGEDAAEDKPSIQEVNTGLGEILDTHLNPAADGESVDSIVDRLKRNLVTISEDLAAEVAESNESPELLKQHHDGLAALIAKYDGAINSVATFARTLGSAEKSLKEGNLDRSKINEQANQLQGLDKLNSGDPCPLKTDALVLEKISRADRNREKMLEDIASIQGAYGQMEKLKALGGDLVADAKTDLETALKSEKFVTTLGDSKKSIIDELEIWNKAGYPNPSDLDHETEYSSIKQRMVAGFLGLPEGSGLGNMAIPLERLCEKDRTKIVGELKALGPEIAGALLVELNAIHASQASDAVKAAKSLEAAGKAGLSPLTSADLAKTLYAGAKDSVENYRKFAAVLSNIDTARSSMVGPLANWAKLEKIESGDPSTTVGFISLLEKAMNKLGADSNDIQSVQDFQTHFARFGEGNLADQADQIAQIDNKILDRMEKFTATISNNPISTQITEATNRLEAQARALANAIGGEQGLKEAAKSNRNEQLEVFGGAIAQNLEFQNRTQTQLKSASLDAKDAAEDLHRLIGAKISPDEIAKKLNDNKELALLIQLGIQSQKALDGAEDIPKLAHKFSAQELKGGIRMLAECPIVPVAGSIHLSQSEQTHLAKRNKAIESIKKQMNGLNSENPAKAEKILSKLVIKHTPQIEAFLHEERAYEAMSSLYADGTVTTTQLRSLFEKHSGNYLQTRLVMNRNLTMDELLGVANMKELDQAHLENLKPRIETLASLKDAKNPASIWKDSAYLGGVETRLADLRGEGKSKAAFEGAASGGLVELGKRLHEGDAGKDMRPEQLRVVYLQGQSEAVKRGLKYLNPKNMEILRPGILRRAYNKIFQPDTKYEKLIATTDLKNFGENIAKLSKNSELQSYLKDSFDDLKSQQESLVEKRNALVGDVKKVETGLRMVAIEHLCQLAGSSDNPILSDQDFTQIVKEWKTKLGDSKDAFADLVDKARNSLVGKTISQLEEALDPETRANFLKELNAIEAEERDVASAHARFKEKLDAATDLVTFQEMTRADFGQASPLFEKGATWITKGEVSIRDDEAISEILAKMHRATGNDDMKIPINSLRQAFVEIGSTYNKLIEGLKDETLELGVLDNKLKEADKNIKLYQKQAGNAFQSIQNLRPIPGLNSAAESLRGRLTDSKNGTSALAKMQERFNKDIAKLETLQSKLQNLVTQSSNDLEVDTGSFDADDFDPSEIRNNRIAELVNEFPEIPDLKNKLAALSAEQFDNLQIGLLNTVSRVSKTTVISKFLNPQ